MLFKVFFLKRSVIYIMLSKVFINLKRILNFFFFRSSKMLFKVFFLKRGVNYIMLFKVFINLKKFLNFFSEALICFLRFFS